MHQLRFALLISIVSIVGTASHAAQPAGNKNLGWGTGSSWNAAASAPEPAVPRSALVKVPAVPVGKAPAPPPTPGGAFAPTTPAGDVHQMGAFGPILGTPFSIVCEPGEYVVGFVGTTGAWFDRLTVACAQWHTATNTIGGFHPLAVRAGTSTGGKPDYNYCNGGTAVSRLAVQMMMSNPSHMVLDNIQFDCTTLAQPRSVEETDVIETQEGPDGGFSKNLANGNFRCAAGEFAVGIYGNADEFIHRLGLLCRAEPPPESGPSLSTRMRTTHDVVPPPSRLAHGGRALGAPNLKWDSDVASTSLPITPAPAATPAPASSSQPPFDLPNGPTPPVATNIGMRFNFPHVRGRDGKMTLLDSCATGTSTCGLSVANQFCRSTQPRKPAMAVDYKTFHGTGRDGRTASLPGNAVCTGSACSAFLYVVCKS